MAGTDILSGGITAYVVTKLAAISPPSELPAARIIEVSDLQARAYFTTLTEENYPDLTYAAEAAGIKKGDIIADSNIMKINN